MSLYSQARDDLNNCLMAAQADGHDAALYLRALLSAVVERSKQARSAEDLAQELQFLAANLDDDSEYSFMRP